MTNNKKSPYFDWNNRPEHVNKFTQNIFNQISSVKIFDKGWTYNGASKYNLYGIDESKLITKMVKNFPHQSEFKILDIGAGNFQ